MIEFRVSNLRADRSTLTTPADVFVGISADLEILVDDVPIGSEPDFPVAELAAELVAWLDTGFVDGTDFEFDSMSTPEPGWVWLRRGDSPGWRVGGLHQSRADLLSSQPNEVRTAVVRLVRDVKDAATSNLGVDLTPFLGKI